MRLRRLQRTGPEIGGQPDAIDHMAGRAAFGQEYRQIHPGDRPNAAALRPQIAHQCRADEAARAQNGEIRHGARRQPRTRAGVP